ncbi:MAG TPA: DUF6760 family protein, partial [Nakamurella sp.]
RGGPHQGHRDLSELRAPVRGRCLRGPPGGILSYPTDRLYAELSYVAYHFHWPLSELLDLEHAERQRFVAEVAGINTRITKGR